MKQELDPMNQRPIPEDSLPEIWDRVNTLTGALPEHKFETLATFFPAAKAIKTQLDLGFDAKRVCISAVEYYEPVVQKLQNRLKEYVEKYGTL